MRHLAVFLAALSFAALPVKAFDLRAVPDVRILKGDAKTAFRDPAAFFENGVFHLFFTWARADLPSCTIGHSTSRDLVNWTPPREIAVRDPKFNYSSPGNMVKVGDDYVLCMQTYPVPGLKPYEVEWADETARIFTMKTRDFEHWSEPELIRVKGPDVPEEKMGRMIDAYLIRDRDGLWHCSYKQDGVSFSVSSDLRTWKYVGRIDGGENACIIEDDDGGWVMFHSPRNGIGVKRSKDLVHWTDDDGLLTFGQKDWPWARGRLTAGTVIDCRKVEGVGKYLMFFHATGPKTEREGDNWRNGSLCIAWSDNLRDWSWPASAEEWTWIAADDSTMGHPAQAFEKTFQVPADVRIATLRFVSLGTCEVLLNGRRVGDVELKPGFTYAGTREFHAADVTALLKPGAENRLFAEVSDAYWRDLISGDPDCVCGRPNGFAAKLTLEMTDGTRQIVKTGSDWFAAHGGTLVDAGIYEGETRDMTRDVIAWGRAKVFEPSVSVVPAHGEVRIRQDLVRPAKTRIPFMVRPDERKVIDFGQNAAARESFTVKGPRGCRLEIRHAEVLNPDGTCYFDNLRRTKALTTYVLKGDGPETFRPRHTYYGFRYVEISASEPVEFLSLAMEPISSVRDETSSIVTSDPLVNGIISCAEWSVRSNQMGVPTDCCNRGERLGWMGDACVSAAAACWLWDARDFYLGKVLRDVRDLQRADGAYSSLAPGRAGELGPDKYGVFAWSDAGILIPHLVFRHFGCDLRLSEHYPSMRRYGEWLEKSGGPFPGFWGDWLAFQRTGFGEPRYPYGSDAATQEFLSAAYRVWDFRALSEIAAALGEADDASRFDADRVRALTALRERFLAPDGNMRPAYACQTTYALSLVLGLCPDEEARQRTADALELNVIRSGRRLMTGVLGTRVLLDALAENGRERLAYDLLLSRACPSWGYMVERGATMLWERWDGILSDGSFNDPKMNSFNHADFACVLDWMYRTMAGIRPNPERGGFDSFVLQPRPDRRIVRVEASHRTARGVIRVKSEYAEDGSWSYDYEIPPGATAEVRLPDGSVLPAQTGSHRVVRGPGHK